MFLGCMGKSAQIGLHVWLPDAMEGPTPVSALIHAATMVNAGIFLIVKTNFLFDLSGINHLILIIGSLTALLGSLIALVQTDIKKIIAYSTCSQLGYMFMALGVSAYNIAIFHLITHACFKALLFLCAGNVIHASGTQNITEMGGLSRKIKITTIFTWIGSLALSGIFPFAGYYSKDLIIEYVHAHHIAYLMSLVVVPLTAFYSFKLLFTSFYGKKEYQNMHSLDHFMVYPLSILALFSVFAGILGIEAGILTQKFWGNSILVTDVYHVSLLTKLTPLILSCIGITFALLVTLNKYLLFAHLLVLTACFMVDQIIFGFALLIMIITNLLDRKKYIYRIAKHILEHKFYFDCFYILVIKRVFILFSIFLAYCDKWIDWALTTYPCSVVVEGKKLVYFALNGNGQVSRYMINFLVGIVLYLLCCLL